MRFTRKLSRCSFVSSNYVDNIMVHTDPMNSYCVTLVVASYGALEKWGRASRS